MRISQEPPNSGLGQFLQQRTQPNPNLAALMKLTLPSKPRVFVSYHHALDQFYADRFTRIFEDAYDSVTDRSLDEPLDSCNSEYIYRQIRDKYVSGTSCTIVLCGQQSWSRKFIDWEIKATLDKGHGLLGVILPNHRVINNVYYVPDRLAHNIHSGYASWIQWTETKEAMITAINRARANAKMSHLVENSAPMMGKNC